ncbi:phage capsid protein, partial [Acinetobacter baumannii]
PYDEFKTWLRNKLGQTCQDIRTAIKTKYANAQVCPLIFFPSIRSPIQTLATYINYPSEHYSYPHFDYIMTEAYDWLLEAKLDLAHQAVSQ